MYPLLWVPAGSLILNNFINVIRSYAHINGRINSLGFMALQLMICLISHVKCFLIFFQVMTHYHRRAEN